MTEQLSALDIVRGWQGARNHITAVFRIEQSGVLTPGVSRAINDFTTTMDKWTRDLITWTTQRYGDAHIRLLAEQVLRRDVSALSVYALWERDVTGTPEWTELDREALRELVTNFDKYLQGLMKR